MDFEVGDELVYNPSCPDLPPASQRLRDWGRVNKISNGYIHFRFYCGHSSSILPDAFSYSPNSPKYFRSLYKNVLTELPLGFSKKNLQRYKNIYHAALRDVVHITLTKDYEGQNAWFNGV